MVPTMPFPLVDPTPLLPVPSPVFGPPPAEVAAPSPSAPTEPELPSPAPKPRGLYVAAAVLSVLLIAVVTALISVVRAGR
jgi:hypothetical protein